ncbi:MAG: hypothetical protein DMF86_23140 [Acidobacteria bacterium]|nr:MAG: hypothetical protein DMF86_23140 [Acidobacteriota bacterium]
MLFDRLQNLMRVELEVAHDLAEHVPLHLREREAHVLVGEEGMLAAPGLLERAVDHAFGRLSQLVLRDVEILHERLHETSWPVRQQKAIR